MRSRNRLPHSGGAVNRSNAARFHSQAEHHGTSGTRATNGAEQRGQTE
jgi:hypothetical protein